MRKMAGLCIMMVLLYFCGAKPDQVETIIEDGVEVVINHIEPYKIKGEPNSLHLKKEFSIDLEKDEIAEIGLTSIRSFNVDDDRSIYFIDSSSRDNFIFKFSREGQFILSFGRKGQGPGEMQWPDSVYNMRENLIVAAMSDTPTRQAAGHL